MSKKDSPTFPGRFGQLIETAKKLPVRLEDVQFLERALQEVRNGFNTRLLGQIETTDPYEDWMKYEDGDALFEMKKAVGDQDWHMTKNGLVVRTDVPGVGQNGQNNKDRSSTFVLRDTKKERSKTVTTPFQGQTYTTHPDGVLYQHGTKLVLNNGKILFYHPDAPYSFRSHPRGFVVHKDWEVWLNGNILLTDRINEKDEFKVHEGGIIVRREANGGYQFYENNRHLLLTDDGTKNDLWLATEGGVITIENVPNGMNYYLNDKLLANRKKAEALKPHRDGVVFVDISSTETQLTLNDGKTLYAGNLEGFKSYMDGVVVHRKKSSNRNTYEFVYYNGERL